MQEHPEFNILGTMGVTFTKEEDGKTVRRFRVIASSTVEDSHGDEISETAIERMAAQANASPLTMFLNHEYRVPEDVFGTVTKASVVTNTEGGVRIRDLILDGIVNDANPRATQTADLSANGSRLGTSIGARVKDYRPKSAKDPMGGWFIDDLELKEVSIVGLPSNPRTWVEYATKAIRRFERERVKEALDMTKTATEQDIEPMEADYLTVEDIDVSKIATTETFLGPEADPEPEPDPDLPPESEPEADEGDEEPAPEEGSPDADKKASETPAELLLSQAIESSAESVATSAMKEALVVAKAELLSRQERIDQLEYERNAALATLATATAIVNQIASTPLGRKATFTTKVDDYRARVGHVYSPEVLKILKGTEVQ